MGIDIRVRINTSVFARRMDALVAKQMPFAVAKALTDTAKDAQAEGVAEMRRVFDRPTPYALKSLFIRPATKQRLHARVYVKDDTLGGFTSSAEQLGHQFEGGARKGKRLEGLLLNAGLLSRGEYVVPGEGARFDSYGNISRGQVQQILSQLKVGNDPNAYKSTSKRSKRAVARAGAMFWSPGGALPRGVWMRRGAGVLPILIVVRTPRYRQRIDLEAITRRTVERKLQANFDRALRTALASAR